MSNPTPPSPDALREIANSISDPEHPVAHWSDAVTLCTAADALEAFRAVAEALFRCDGVTLSTPRRSEVCTYCSAPARHRKGSTCPVALARAAMERFPEVAE